MTSDRKPDVPREQGGIESARQGKDLEEHGRVRGEPPAEGAAPGPAGPTPAAEIERELEGTHDEERRQWRGSTPDEQLMERALEVDPDDGQERS